MFGPTIGEEKEGFNVPMTLAFATARVRGHPLHPGGLLKLMSVPGVGDEYEVIRMICVPFWISALPEQTRYRIFNPSFATYTGTWRPQLVPVTFERYRKPWKSGRPRRTKIMP
jgi:hypothetical protein